MSLHNIHSQPWSHATAGKPFAVAYVLWSFVAVHGCSMRQMHGAWKNIGCILILTGSTSVCCWTAVSKQVKYIMANRKIINKRLIANSSTRVSAAADRPARRSGSAHAKYSESLHMVIKPFLLLGLAAEYRSRRLVWSTVVRRPSEVYDTYRRT